MNDVNSKIKKDLLILFAKSPSASDVKTRLSPMLAQKERARLQKAFILDTLSLTADLCLNRALACTPDTKGGFFAQCEKEHSVLLLNQEGDNLGERMQNGFRWAFSCGFERVVIIGSDAPTLPASFIQEAFNKLKTMRIVLGPAIDGGYYLIGANGHVPDIFSNIKWGSDTVFADTITQLHQYHLLPFWYDVDYPEDIVFLRRHIFILKKQGRRLPIETIKVMNKTCHEHVNCPLL